MEVILNGNYNDLCKLNSPREISADDFNGEKDINESSMCLEEYRNSIL